MGTLDAAFYKKIDAMTYFLNQMRNLEKKAWVEKDGIRILSGDIQAEVRKQLGYYGEAFLFEFGSALDILIKVLLHNKSTDIVYFNYKTLKQLHPKDEYLKFLKKCYSAGLFGDSAYSISSAKDYRNLVTHGDFLQIPFDTRYRRGIGVRRFVIPDNPKERGHWKFNKNIELIDYCEKLWETIDKTNERTEHLEKNTHYTMPTDVISRLKFWLDFT